MSEKHHTLTASELNQYIEEPRWIRYASSAHGRTYKTFEYMIATASYSKGESQLLTIKYRVTFDGNQIAYEGYSQTAALDAYNNAR